MNKKLVVIIHGLPLSGKSGLGEDLAQKLELPFLESGPLLKAALGAEKLRSINSGALARSDDFNRLVIPKLKEFLTTSGGFVAAGTGRKIEEAKSIIELVKTFSAKLIIFQLDVELEELEKRRLKRQEREGRLDDDSESFQKRLSCYSRDTVKVLELYRQLGCLIKINGNQDEIKTHQDAYRRLRQLLKNPA